MKINGFIYVGLCCFLTAVSCAQEATTSEVSLFELIMTFSNEQGTNFVIRPSLNRTVRIVGADPTGIDASSFIEILTSHGLTALEKDGIVFIMSEQEAATVGDRYERRWEG